MEFGIVEVFAFAFVVGAEEQVVVLLEEMFVGNDDSIVEKAGMPVSGVAETVENFGDVWAVEESPGMALFLLCSSAVIRLVDFGYNFLRLWRFGLNFVLVALIEV